MILDNNRAIRKMEDIRCGKVRRDKVEEQFKIVSDQSKLYLEFGLLIAKVEEDYISDTYSVYDNDFNLTSEKTILPEPHYDNEIVVLNQKHSYIQVYEQGKRIFGKDFYTEDEALCHIIVYLKYKYGKCEELFSYLF